MTRSPRYTNLNSGEPSIASLSAMPIGNGLPFNGHNTRLQVNSFNRPMVSLSSTAFFSNTASQIAPSPLMTHSIIATPCVTNTANRFLHRHSQQKNPNWFNYVFLSCFIPQAKVLTWYSSSTKNKLIIMFSIKPGMFIDLSWGHNVESN